MSSAAMPVGRSGDARLQHRNRDKGPGDKDPLLQHRSSGSRELADLANQDLSVAIPTDDEEDDKTRAKRMIPPSPIEKDKVDLSILAVILLVAAFVRFYRIDHPNSVVFDEVHFGKFASYYLRREYFFDVHPPLAKLMIAAAGWLIGYDGHFDFEAIGDDYIANKVPYMGLRALPAMCGTLYCPIIYAIMRESGLPRIVSVFSAALVVFDNAHITHSRLILLDTQLLLFMAAAFYSYVRFYKLRFNEFNNSWWLWLHLTGLFLALTLSCKINGLLAFFAIGTAVLVDFWNMIDYRRNIPLQRVWQHFAARAWALIAFPLIVYLSFFYIHFAVLTHSGTGDDFMSPAFQETLLDSPLLAAAKDIRYFDGVVLQHKQTKAFLHSHLDRYPLRYEDGRVSSAGQQVTCYPFNDTNNQWQVLPTDDFEEEARGRIVRNKDIIQLRHINSDSVLLSHDVASPLMPTNTEFTTWAINDTSRYNDTLFRLEVDAAHGGQSWKSKSGYFKLIHLTTGVAMWSHADPVLPEWGYQQQEVNGNKNAADKTNIWVISDIIKDPNSEITDMEPTSSPAKPRQAKKRSFVKKWWELQNLMMQHNAGLTDSHPYATGPFAWPFLYSGISFWTGKEGSKQQIYLIGNPVSWWLSSALIAVLVGILFAIAVSRRRGALEVPVATVHRIHNSTGFLFMAWGWHYLPFFLMNRQLFLHHYLPAHLLAVMIAGSTLYHMFTDSVEYTTSLSGPLIRRRPKTLAKVPLGLTISIVILIALTVSAFIFFNPLTYGTPGLDVASIRRRQWFPTWTMHFAK